MVAGRCEAGNGVSGLGKWCYRDAETWDARILDDVGRYCQHMPNYMGWELVTVPAALSC